jgi:hypothetical protein
MRSFLLLVALVGGGSLLGRDQPAASAPALEFRIVANPEDDAKAIDAAALYLTTAKEAVKKLAEKGEPPPTPADLKSEKAAGFGWVRLHQGMLQRLDLDDAAEKDEKRGKFWQQAAAAREKGEAVLCPQLSPGMLLFSRTSTRPGEMIEYFVLLRAMPAEQTVTGRDLERALAGTDEKNRPCLYLHVSKEAGERFHALSSANKDRQLAVVLRGEIEAAAAIRAPIRTAIQITGDFTREQAEKAAVILRTLNKPG